MILAGDIGGTKTNLALFSGEGSDFTMQHFASFPSQKYPDLKSIVVEYKSQVDAQIEAATFAIAGPVQRGVCKTTNLPWVVETTKLQEALGSKEVYLINDLEANAYSVEILPESSVHPLHVGDTEPVGNRAVISPGTGLGEAGLYFDRGRFLPFACEGGHTEFGPRDQIQLDLCGYLIHRFGHASYERILSGPGLHNLFLFLKEKELMHVPDWLKEKMQEMDPSRVITEEGLKSSCNICVEALNLFVSILGAEASNCVLKFMATGGIYIGGGIAPKILSKLEEPTFFEGFIDKGRFASLLKEVPIHIILDDKASLYGASHHCRLQRAPKVSV